MSESTDIPVIDTARDAIIQRRRANLAKARAARGKNPRKAVTRTAADARHAGVGSNPGPAQRAAPARDDVEVRTRTRRDQRDSGWADLPPHRRKPGWDYEYKVIRVLREPVDPADMLEVRNAGWRPELAKDWPELVEPGTPPDSPIERRGQRLYGRPMSLTNEARQEDIQAAYQQQKDKTLAAASGRSAVRGEDGIPNQRGVRSVPIEISITGEAG